ncbi:hypothetical protein [Agaribacterium sp. ZY112]|uniref:hypothetical protein n=1 Tax=Agaribacterium sp. ZY112 TaxID=3233574 RepID=UPI0035254053
MQTYLPYLMIVLAVCMAVGPVMMLKPSARAKRQAALRAEAAQQHLLVSMLSPDDLGLRVNYQLPIERALEESVVEWELSRQRFEHGAHFHKDWDWSDKDLQQSSAGLPLQRYLDQLPESICGVGQNRIGLYLVWREKGLGPEPKDIMLQLRSWLLELKAL